MTLIDLLKVMDDDTKVVITHDRRMFPVVGTVEEVFDELTPRELSMTVNNVYYSRMYSGIYIIIE